MKRCICLLLMVGWVMLLSSCEKQPAESNGPEGDQEPGQAQDSGQAGVEEQWEPLFEPDLANAIYPEGVWSFDDGILTATEDQCIWTEKEYDAYVLELEFKTAESTNSGVIVHCSNIEQWIPNSVEIQIADDYSEPWSTSPPTWQCGAFFGHKAPTKSAVRKPGEWNTMRVECEGKMIYVDINGERVNEMDMSLWTSAEVNPDGSEIPSWLSKPVAELPTKGHIGLQGKHAGAPIFFRNMKIRVK